MTMQLFYDTDLQEFDPDTLASLLEFMYTAKITITEENAQDILMGKGIQMSRLNTA